MSSSSCHYHYHYLGVFPFISLNVILFIPPIIIQFFHIAATAVVDPSSTLDLLNSCFLFVLFFFPQINFRYSFFPTATFKDMLTMYICVICIYVTAHICFLFIFITKFFFEILTFYIQIQDHKGGGRILVQFKYHRFLRSLQNDALSCLKRSKLLPNWFDRNWDCLCLIFKPTHPQSHFQSCKVLQNLLWEAGRCSLGPLS